MHRNLSYLFIALGLFSLSGCSEDPEPPVSTFSDSPADIDITTSDIDLFWITHDHASGLFKEEDFLNNYFRAGTESLNQFFEAKIKNAAAITQKLSDENYHAYYNSIRSNSQHIDVTKVRQALNLFEQNYEPAVFSNVVLVIGALGTGGTVVPNGNMVIGAEFFTKSPTTPTDKLSPWVASVTREVNYLPSIVLHELVHVQQRNFAITENLTSSETLLEKALAEGIADFIAFKLLGTYFNDHLPDYADNLEEELWNEFKLEMGGSNTSNWLFNAATSQDRPGDLGYYIGLKIAEHYYINQPNHTTALKELLEISNADDFLTLSRYQSKFN